MEWPSPVIHLGALVLLTAVVVNTAQRFILDHVRRKQHPLPPGPTPLPLLGSILSIDPKAPWLTYTKWQANYGDIMHFRLLDADMIVLNSASVANELLAKRAQIYSDRPFVATLEPYGHDCNFAFSRYGEHWRLCRRIFHQTFHAGASLTFRPMQVHTARQMIVNILDDPDDYPSHYSTFSAAVAMSSVYDYQIKLRNDPVISVFEKFLRISFPAILPEKAAILKAFPFLLSIPEWLPGSRMRRESREAVRCRNETIEMSYGYVLKRMECKEQINDTMVINHLIRMANLDEPHRAEYELALKHASLTSFIGSVETTSTTVMIFTLAMVKNPRVWKHAQADINAIIGMNRLPEFEDRKSLPYVDAIIRETLRWKPFVPLGVPHATTESDIYDGFYIPKGATIVPNVWGMLRDEARYPNPDVFRPERFLDAKGLLTEDDPAEPLFGFGRRKCPGRHFADASIWCAIATMLATLEFHAAKDKDGNEIVFEAIFTNGITNHPLKFPCLLTPRAHITKEVLECALTH